MKFFTQIIASSIPFKSIKTYYEYFETVERFVVNKDKNERTTFFVLALLSIYNFALNAIFLTFPNISNETKIIFADWNLLLNENFFYLFYLVQTLMIIYFFVALYLRGDIVFVRYMRKLMSANDFKDKNGLVSYIEGIKSLFKYHNKRASISQRLQNIGFIVINQLQGLQIILGKKIISCQQIYFKL